MEAGRMDRRITLQRSTKATDAFNQPIETFVTLATVWASVEYISDGEKARASEIYANLFARFRVRYAIVIADLNAKDRLIFDGDTYDIVAVKEIGRHEGFELTAATRGDK